MNEVRTSFRRHLVVSLFAAAFLALVLANQSSGLQDEPCCRDWAVQDGFSLSVDADGFVFPSAIAFVPNPGPEPKDPLYFVAEIHGAIKVVTNDRTVLTFAESSWADAPGARLFSTETEEDAAFGQAGLCLDPTHGYVFATFAYPEQDGTLRNSYVRYETEPQTFAVEPSGQEFSPIPLDMLPTGSSHQIGPCQVEGEQLFIGVGDGKQRARSQDLNALFGKVLRASLDGQPLPDNPFYQADETELPGNYVYAYGFRNPFGLAIVDGRLFTADNGNAIDRFLEIEPGANYLWDGTDWSIGSQASAIFAPAIGPTHLVYLPDEFESFPEEYREIFYLATSAYESNQIGIIGIPYDLDRRALDNVSQFLVRYAGTTRQLLVALAAGPDGLYFAPVIPSEGSETTPILKLQYEPEQEHPIRINSRGGVGVGVQEVGCLACHRLDGAGGSAGPPLDRGPLVANLQERLHAQAYLDSLEEVDQLTVEPYTQFTEAREEVRAAEGMDRIRTWMTYHIHEPRFDNPLSQMPNLGLTLDESAQLTDSLLATTETSAAEGIRERAEATILPFLDNLFPNLGYSDLALAAFVGAAIGGFIVFILMLLVVRRRASRRT